MSALDTQVAGSHYKSMKIQPVEFITANNIGFLEGCIIKRICRWRNKDGIQDLEKIKHEVDLLIELHNRESNKVDPVLLERLAVQNHALYKEATGKESPFAYKRLDHKE